MSQCVKLFNMDLHISVIEDVKTHLKRYFENDVEITEWCVSGHHSIVNKPKASPKWVNASNWRHIDEEAVRRFVTEYKGFLSSFDGFIVTHSPVFALLFQAFNKPIYVLNSCRFDQPMSGQDSGFRRHFIEQLCAMDHQGLLTIVSNNKGDQAYLKRETGIQSAHIPSLCSYTGVSYKGIRDQFLMWGNNELNIQNVVHKSKLGFGYPWSLVCEFKAIIHIPYEISTMSLFEHYTSSIPLIIPSKGFLKQLGTLWTLSAYNMKGDLDTWIENADFYDVENMPYITYFDSWYHLQVILDTLDCATVHRQMVEHNEIRRKRIENDMDKSFELFARGSSKQEA